MKLEKELVEEVAKAIANERSELFDETEYKRFVEKMNWAWDNWPPHMLYFYYRWIKPKRPPKDFKEYFVTLELNIPENWEKLIRSFLNLKN